MRASRISPSLFGLLFDLLVRLWLPLWLVAQAAAAQTASIVPTPNIGHGAAVNLIALSADGQHLVTSDRHTVKLWQMSSGRLVRTLEALPAPSRKELDEESELPGLNALTITGDGALVFGSDDKDRLLKWDTATGNLLRIVEGHAERLAVTPDGSTLIAASYETERKGGITSWSVATLEKLGARDGGSWQIALTPKGDAVFVSGQTHAELLALPDLKPLKSLPAAINATNARISDDGGEVVITQYVEGRQQWRAVGLSSGAARTLAAGASHELKALGAGGRALFEDRSANPDSFSDPTAIVVVTPGEGGNGGERVRIARPLLLDAAAFSADGFSLVTAEGNLVEVWDTRTGTATLRLEGPQAITSLSVSDDGQRLLVLDEAGTAFVWRTLQGELDRPPLVHVPKPDAGRMSADGKSVYLLHPEGDDGRAAITVTDENGGRAPFPPAGWQPFGGWRLNGTGGALEFPQGLIALVSDTGREVALWDTGKSAIAHRLPLPATAGRPDWAEVGADRARALVRVEPKQGGPDAGNGIYLLWNLDKGAVEQTLQKIDGKGIASARLSPDGKWLVAGNDDKQSGGMVQVRSLASGKVTKQFRLEKGKSLASARFSPDGRYYIVTTIWPARWGQETFRTSDWSRVDYFAQSKWGQRNLVFLDRDRRVLATEGWSRQTRRHVLKTGVGSGERTLFELAVRSARLVDAAVDAKGERVAMADGPEIIVVKAADGAVLSRLAGHLADVTALRFLPDGHRLASGGRDGTVRIWDLRSNALAATFVASKDGQWLAFTPAGFYAGSDRPGRLMSVVREWDVYSIEQFYGPLYRPDLVKEILSGDAMGLHKDAATKLSLGAVIERGSAPTVTKLEQPRRAGDTMQFRIQISNNGGGGIGRRLHWRVNGALAGRTEPEELQQLADPDAPAIVTEGLKLDFKRKQGNVVTVVAFNGAEDRLALAGEPVEFRIAPDGGVSTVDEPAPRMHVLAIGVNSYDTRLQPGDEHKLTPLTLAVGDVQRLKGAIAQVSATGGWEQGLVPELVEADARRDRIEDEFRVLAGTVKPADAFVLLLAGHGHSVDGRYYYYPSTTKIGEGRNYETEGIPTETWQKWLAMVPADKKLVVIDTCRSSDFLGRGEDEESTAVDRLRRAVGRSVITAARDTAFESRHLKHGILTYALLRALSQPRADGKDITLSTLKERIPQDVRKLSTDLGAPAQKTRILVEDDFPLGQPLAALNPPPIVAAATLPGDWVVKAPTKARKRADANAEVNEPLDPGTPVKVAEYAGSWALVVHKGTVVGWVPQDSLLKIKN